MNNFDFLRLMAATMVLVSHQFILSGYAEPELFPGLSYGALALEIFFAISGYLVTKSWQDDPHLWRFIVKRCLRIFPALIVFSFTMMFIVGPLITSALMADYFSSKMTWKFLENIFLIIKYELPGVFLNIPYPKAVNGSLWTLPLEFRCYELVALFGVLRLIKIKFFLIMSWVGLASWLYSFVVPEIHYLVYYGLYFLGGTICASIEFSKKIFLFLMGTAMIFLYFKEYLFFSALVLPLSVVFFGQASFPIIRGIAKFGDISFGVYIFAFPVQQILLTYMEPSVSWSIFLGSSLLLTYCLAYVSWHFIENPALSLKKYLY